MRIPREVDSEPTELSFDFELRLGTGMSGSWFSWRKVGHECNNTCGLKRDLHASPPRFLCSIYASMAHIQARENVANRPRSRIDYDRLTTGLAICLQFRLVIAQEQWPRGQRWLLIDANIDKPGIMQFDSTRFENFC